MNSKNNEYILSKFDVSGIQSYIFATNRLRENVGASCQVTRILEEFLSEAIMEETVSQQEYALEWKKKDSLLILKRESVKAEIIYIGGGNAMVLFRNKQIFEKVCHNLGMKVAKKCQGIYLAAAYVQTPLQNFKEDMKELGRKLAENKAHTIRQPIYSPFPVVEQDNSNHQPITRCYVYKKDEENTEASYIIENMTEMQYQKWMSYQWSRKNRDEKLYPVLNQVGNYDYPVDMEHLCDGHGGNSYIAVVHIDGNGMGRQILEVLYANEEYTKAVGVLREKSEEISHIFRNTYKAVLLKLCKHTELLKKVNQGKVLLPLRPIVLDGDDFTFLCTAELAVPIAAGFLTELSKSQEGSNRKITACAGIAFVHSHFPFNEAYRIAEDMCSKAKDKWYRERKEEKNSQENSQENNFLDFCVLKGTEVGGIQGHREWQMRPYYVAAENKELRNDSLYYLYNTIKKMEDKWPSNRLHRIYQAMLEGEESMELLEKEFISREYYIKELIQADDWKCTPLYDALELRGLCKTELLADFLNV